MFGRDKADLIENLPMVPMRDLVVFPHMMIPFVIGRKSSIRALEQALQRGKRIFLSAQHDATRDNPGPEEIHTIGTVCSIVQSLKLPDANVKVLVEGLERGARARVPRGERRRCRVIVKLVPASRAARDRAREPDLEGDRDVRAVRQALEQPALRRDARRGAGRGPGPPRRHHLLAPHRAGRGEAEPARDLRRPGAPDARLLDPGGRGRQAARRPPHPGPRQEADGARAEGVLPQREDEGDPEGARPQGRPHQRGRRAPEEGRAVAHAQGRRGKGARRS